MKVEIHRNLSTPIVIDATRVLLTYDDGTPFAFAIDYIPPNHVRCFRAEDSDFNEQLRIHGIDRVVFVDRLRINGDKLNDRAFRGIIRG